MAGLEEATDAQIPFVGDSVDVTNPMMLLATMVSLILGFTLFSMTESIGEQVAAAANNTLASLTGSNVGGASGDDGVPGV